MNKATHERTPPRKLGCVPRVRHSLITKNELGVSKHGCPTSLPAVFYARYVLPGDSPTLDPNPGTVKLGQILRHPPCFDSIEPYDRLASGRHGFPTINKHRRRETGRRSSETSVYLAEIPKSSCLAYSEQPPCCLGLATLRREKNQTAKGPSYTVTKQAFHFRLCQENLVIGMPP